MNNSNPFLSVIMPAYNEENRLPATLKKTVAYLNHQSYTWELIVVNDGSTDNTVKIVKQESITEERIKLLSYGENKGKGYAVKYGMTKATGQLRLFMDADNSTSINHVENFFPYLERGYDVVIGSRDIAGSFIAVHQIWWKEKLGDLGNIWIQLWAVPGIKDTQAGFKIFTAKAAENIFPYLTIDRWGFDVEALAVAKLKGYKIIERPIKWINDANSKVSPKAYLDVLKEVVQVRLNIMKGVYKNEL